MRHTHRDPRELFHFLRFARVLRRARPGGPTRASSRPSAAALEPALVALVVVVSIAAAVFVLLVNISRVTVSVVTFAVVPSATLVAAVFMSVLITVVLSVLVSVFARSPLIVTGVSAAVTLALPVLEGAAATSMTVGSTSTATAAASAVSPESRLSIPLALNLSLGGVLAVWASRFFYFDLIVVVGR